MTDKRPDRPGPEHGSAAGDRALIRGLDDERRAPKYAHVERERWFLVDPDRLPDLAAAPTILIEDRYIRDTRLRLRRMTSGDRIVLKLTKKYAAADSCARPIVTTYLDAPEYALLAALPAAVIVKRRSALAGWSIDRFEGALAGLVLAESEQPDAGALAALAPPAWALREVTDDPRYEGGTLALLTAA